MRQQTQSGTEIGIVSPVILGREDLRGGHPRVSPGVLPTFLWPKYPMCAHHVSESGLQACSPSLLLESPILAAHSHHLNAMRLAPRALLEGRWRGGVSYSSSIRGELSLTLYFLIAPM